MKKNYCNSVELGERRAVPFFAFSYVFVCSVVRASEYKSEGPWFESRCAVFFSSDPAVSSSIFVAEKTGRILSL